MPTYEYRCKTCGEHLEVVQAFNDAPLSKCGCGGELRKVFSPIGIVFKGSGFYKTDSRSSSRTPASPKPAPEKQEAGKETATTTSTGSSPASEASSASVTSSPEAKTASA
ncbi:MAG: FmdB family zinc ribbon protein [Actinomycetota bacterium]